MKLSPLLLFTALLFSCSNPTPPKQNTDSLAASDTTHITPNQTEDPGDASDPETEPRIEFGFCDMDGKKIMMTTDTLADPSKFSCVIAADRKIANAKYIQKQKATAGDNGRQTEFNFKNCAGYLFEMKGNVVTRDHSVILMTPEFVAERKLLAINPPVKKELPAAVKSRIENGKQRKIKDYRCLTLLGKDSAIYIFEFENKGDSALASLAFVTPGKIVYEDFASLYNEMSTWRVDDGGSFGVDYFDLLAVFEKNGKIEIVTDWPGAEGVNTEYLKEDGTIFKSIKGEARYTAPD
jgi:hypothetical protein